MKKIFIPFVAVLFMVTNIQAQDATFAKGDKVVNLGIGLLWASLRNDTTE